MQKGGRNAAEAELEGMGREHTRESEAARGSHEENETELQRFD